MVPVFEYRACAQQCVQVSGLVVGDATEQDMMVRTFDHGDGVDLDIAQTLDRLEYSGLALAEGAGCSQALRGYSNAPQSRDDVRRCVYGCG